MNVVCWCLQACTSFADELLLPRPLPDDCTPELPEFFCVGEEHFAWCEDSRFVDSCPSGLQCDTKLPFLCVQPVQHGVTLPPTDNTTLEIPDENIPWDMEATPPPSCLKPGRFPDINDCTAFHVCIADTSGNLTHQVINCPSGSHYSAQHARCTAPERAKCDADFQDYECTNSGRLPDPKNCKKFIVCYPEGIWQRYSCPENSYFDADTSNCSTSQSVCLNGVDSKFMCTSRGLFPHESNCRKFYYCIPIVNKGFVQGSVTCPRGSIFNPATSRCTLRNVCDPVENFCMDRRFARYPDPDDCSSFYTCAGNMSAAYTCPYGSRYSPQFHRCVQDSRSECGRSHLACREQGRFPDLTSMCKGFYVCLNRPGGLVAQRYKCPGASHYDPTLNKCSLNYEGCINPYTY